MRRLFCWLAGIQLLLAVGLVATAPSADATSTRWQLWDTPGQTVQLVCCGPTTVTVKCGSGTSPLMGGYVVGAPNGSRDVRRLAEFVNSYDGGTYSVTLDDETGSNPLPTITPWVRCVDSSRLVNSFQQTGTLYTGNNDLAGGSVSCGSGYTALTGSVYPSGSGGTVLTSGPTGGSSWQARSWSSEVGSATYVFVRCVPTSNFNGALRTVPHDDPVGWGAGASATCAVGMLPVAGGTWYAQGDGGAISVMPTTSFRDFSSTTLSLSTGSITTTVLCMPGWDPDVTISGAATPAPNSATVRWDFTATDRAGGSGFTVSTTCQIVRGTSGGLLILQDWQACTSPKQMSGLVDGWNQLNLRAVTSDGRETVTSSSVLVDTTVPVVTFDDPAGTVYPTSAPSVPVHVTDNFYLDKVQCAVDGGDFVDCGNGTQGAKTLALSGVADGAHTLHVRATDSKTNTATYDVAFKVDTTPPTAALTAPTSRFTLATKVGLAWTGSDAVSGIASWSSGWERSAYNAGFGAWTGTATSPGSAKGRSVGSLARGSTYCFHVDATDAVGNASAWSRVRCTVVPLDDRDLAASSGWARSAPKGWFNGTALTATLRGSSLALTGVTLKRVALVARKCPTCGVVGVYVGGVRVARIDLHAATSARRVIAVPAFSLRTATVSVKVLSSGRTVQVDALAVSRI
ncbi:MAG TPA: hypothetical protein VN088_17555 [Nocardioides sp.]|nr:hypothetical protein [Nocardioides sp.]